MYLRSLLAVFVLFYAIHIPSLAADPIWNYGLYGPDVWVDDYPGCGGNTQSPINIFTVCTIQQQFPVFQFSDTYNAVQSFQITNNGHTLSATLVNAADVSLELSGGGLNETYSFANFHLHWGENHNSGSEHQINGHKYAGELHIVHTYTAADNSTLYAVLGVFIYTNSSSDAIKSDITNTYNQNTATLVAWDEYFSVADQLANTNDAVIVNFTLATLLGGDLTNFYRYAGSLTTPPCTETVTWTVFQTPIQFTETEIEGLRTNVYAKDFRVIQPLNGRTVYRSFQNNTPPSISDYLLCGQSSGGD